MSSTRWEPCDSAPAQTEPDRPEDGPRAKVSARQSRLAIDAVVVLAGVVYVALALVFQLSSPLIGAAIVIAAGHELIKR